MKVKNFVLLLGFFFLWGFFCPKETSALARMESDNFRITWPNLNMIGGSTTSPGYRMGVTGGQTAPGLYSSLGYKIRSGFQYIHSIIPFSFQLSDIRHFNRPGFKQRGNPHFNGFLRRRRRLSDSG